MYCPGPALPDDVCAPAASVACALVTDCPQAQTCFEGRCVSSEAIADGGVERCTVGAVPDKCAPDAVCAIAGTATCVGLPWCGADGGCPAGALSVACNLQPDGGHIVPGKGALCLRAECAGGSDCRAGALCAHPSSAVPYGTCQLGVTGDPCASATDCVSSAVCQPSDAGGDAGSVCKCVISTPDAGPCAGK